MGQNQEPVDSAFRRGTTPRASWSAGHAFALTAWRRHRRRAGRSTLAEFRRLRRQTLRKEWRGWAVLVGFAFVAAAAAWLFDGFLELLFAGMVGAIATLLLIGWCIGFDVHSLPWYWGHLGERWTEEELNRLGDDWLIEHDVPRQRGNWDHILVGPPGVFLLDSKFFSEPTTVEGDALLTGRRRYEGRVFRGPALGLSEELERLAPPQPWVQAVAVVWGEFPQKEHEGDRVAYLRGYELVAWLEKQPERIPMDRRRALFAAIAELRVAAVAEE
jgi:Nuclease-related domain